MSIVRATTRRSVVRVTQQGGDGQAANVKVYLDSYRPLSELFTTLQFEFSGGGIPVVAGAYFDVTDIPFPCRMDQWTFGSGVEMTDCEIELLRATYEDYPNFVSIGPPISIDNVNKGRDGTEGWDREFAPGDTIRAQIISNTVAQRIALSCRMVRLSRNS